MSRFNPACHLCLVSDQPTPNITPVLDASFRPDKVIFLTSPEKHQQAERLKRVIRPYGVHTSIWLLDDAMDIEHIRNRVLELLQEMTAADATAIALNATGGTKPMSIAAYEVFRGLDLPIFYVHPEQDRVIWMHPSGMASFDIEDRIRLPQFLQAHGVESKTMSRTAMPGRLQRLTRTLIQDIDRFIKPLGTLNYLAFQARTSLHSHLPDDKQHWRELTDLLALFAQEQLLEVSGGDVRFHDEDARFFINGGWLEHHVFAELHRMRSGNSHIHDLAQGLEVQRGEVCNEIDVAFLCDNRLHLIECKTKQFKQGGSDTVYKLDSLTDALGGLRAASMLVSFQSLGRADKNRAKQAHIAVCAGRDIQRLDDNLRRWIGS